MKKLYRIKITIALFCAFVTYNSFSQTTWYWCNGGLTNVWNDANNWDSGVGDCGLGAGTPIAGDSVVFDGTSIANCTINVTTASLVGFRMDPAYTGTVTQAAGSNLNISSGANGLFRIDGGTFVGGTTSITITGQFKQTGGSFTSTSGLLNIGGNFTSSGGTFADGGGTVNFNKNSLTINNTPTFNNLTFTNAVGSASLTFTIASSITVNGTLTLNHSGTTTLRSITLNGGTINAKGNISLNGTAPSPTTGGGTTNIILNGAGAQTITGRATDGEMPLPSLEINSSTARTIDLNADNTYATVSGTFTISGSGDISIGTTALRNISTRGAITVTNTGTSGGGSGTILLEGTASPTFTGSGTLGQGKLPNIVFNKSSGTVTLASVISANGNWTNNNSGTGAISGGTSTVVFGSGAAQAINGTATSHNFNHLIVDKSANTLSISGSITTLNIAGNVTLTNGTFDAGAASLNLTAASAIWSQATAFTFTNGTSTVDFQGATAHSFAGTATTYNFYNLTFAGTLTAPSGTLKVRNNFTNNGTFTHNSGTVEFDGTGVQAVGGTATKTTFYNMKVSTSAHTVNMANNADLINKIDVMGTATFDADGTANDKTFTLLSTSTKNGNTFTGGGTAQVGNLSAGTFNGNVTYQRYIDGFTEWRTLGCPITGRTIADWNASISTSGFTGSDAPSDPFISIYTLNAATQAYTAATNTTNPISADDVTIDGKGFLAYIGNTSPGTVMSPGITLSNTGAIVSGTKTPAISSSGPGLYNLMANPYPAPLLFSSFYTTNSANITNFYWVYDYYTAAFDVWDGTLLTSSNGRTSGTIANGQGFYVNATAGASLTFNEIHKAGTADGNFLKMSASLYKKMRLTISSATATPYSNSMLVAFSPVSADGYFVQEDALEMAPFSWNAPSITSFSTDGKNLVINKMADLTKGYDILVRTKVGVSGTYTITAPDLSEISGCITLEDKLTGAQTDLRSTNSYTFTISDTTNAPRFVLHISSPISVNTQAINASCNGSNNGFLVATPAGTGPWNFIWKNQKDSVLRTMNNKSSADSLPNLAAGTYKVVVASSGGSCSNDYLETLTINQPAPIIASFIADNTTVDKGLPVYFTNYSTGAANYQWNFGDSNTDNTQNPNHTYAAVGDYTVMLIASAGSCKPDTTTQIIHVVSPLGVNNTASNNNITIINNGSGVFVKLDFDQTVNGSIQLFDVLGKIILTQNFSGNHNLQQIAVPSVENGIYLVKISAGNTIYTNRVFIGN